MLLGKWRGSRAPKKILFASSEDNKKLSTLETRPGTGKQRTDIKGEGKEKQRHRGRMQEINEEQILLQSILDNQVH